MQNRFLGAALTFGALLAPSTPTYAHGGQYRGPGDLVPPTTGPRHGGDDAAPGPGPAGAPRRPGAPRAPGPGRFAPPGAPNAPPRRTGGGAVEPDLTLWSFWWEFNKDPYLRLKEAVHAGGTRTGSDGFYLGHGQRDRARDTLAPEESQIRQSIVPALLRALETEDANDVVTGALVALARIGDVKSESGESAFARVIAAELRSPVQEIRETAAVALGILGHDASLPLLTSLLRDTQAGRAAVGETRVGERTRAFAAYGLALIGAQTADEERRREIVRQLAAVLDGDPAFDLATACVIGMGLVPLETVEAPVAAGGPSRPEASRTAQLDYLLRYVAEASHDVARAHCPRALVRLLGRSGGVVPALPDELAARYEQEVGRALLACLDRARREPDALVRGAILALGRLGDADSDALDVAIRDALARVPNDFADQQARYFSTIAMAQVGSDLGRGREQAGASDAGVTQAVRYLERQLAKGRSGIRPWAGLAIGVLARGLEDALGGPSATTTSLAALLRSELAGEKAPTRVGAYAVGLGIVGDRESIDDLRGKLDRLSDDETRGYLALALGLVRATEATADIREVVADARYRPELLKQAAISLGLLGDKDVVPLLVDMLADAEGLAAQAAISSALGFIGDRRSVGPLVEMLENDELTDRARGFAAVALGIVADRAELPWNTRIALDLNYRASTQTLTDRAGTGVLDIL